MRNPTFIELHSSSVKKTYTDFNELKIFFPFFPLQLEDDFTDKTSDDEEDFEEEEPSVDEDEDEEERFLPGDPEDEISTATRAKQLAEHLKTKARKFLRDLGRILAISLLALAGMIQFTILPSQGSKTFHNKKY